MKQWLTRFLHPIQNKRGNILTSAFLAMVILSMALGGIAQLTVNQYITTAQKLDALDQDMLGEALLEQAVYDFEAYLNLNNFDFDGYMADMTTLGYTDYGILVENVSGTSDINGDYTGYDGIDGLAYRFTYTYNDGNSNMVMYSFISNTGTYTESIDPFDFQMASNGYLILMGGYLRNPQFFGDTIVFGNVSPYINQASGLQDKTPASSEYPAVNGNATQAAAYYRQAFYFCEPDCWEISATVSDPFVIQTDEFLDVETVPNSLETGAINEDKIIADFFGGFDLDDQIVDFVKNDGPTGTDVVTDSMSLATIGSIIWNANSGDPEEECVDTNPNPNKETWVCYDGPSSEPYTRLNTYVGFDPSTTSTVLNFAGIYQGNLTINEDFTISNTQETGAAVETMIVDGDVTINNSGAIDIEAFIVVLGDLYITGDDLAIAGGFYVTGETYIQFNAGEGFDDFGANDYSFSLYGMDNILIESIYEAHVKNGNEQVFNWFIYTEESIYAELVNNRLLVNGVFFAAAKGNSGNNIPVEDEYGNPIRGIVINSFDGYVTAGGTETLVNNFTSFDFDPMQEASLHDEFIELPEFQTLLVTEGDYTMRRSEIFYNN